MAEFDFSTYTKSVIEATGPQASARIAEVLPILIRKMHEFCIEADVTVEEWFATCNFLVGAGKVSTEARNEVVLVSDVLGIESLVDTLDQTRARRQQKNEEHSNGANSSSEFTPSATVGAEMDPSYSAILGPFYRSGVPIQDNGTTIVRQDEGDAPYTHLFGVIHDADGKPLPEAVVDIWHDAPDGLYDSQTPHKPQYHCRGRFKTDKDGKYDTICLRPTPYPIPFDHQAGNLLKLLDRHPYRPGHIHFWIEAAAHKTLVTQVFDSESDYLNDDAVFAVKDQLVVHFKPLEPSYTPPAELKDKVRFQLEQNFRLQKSTA